MTTKNNNQFELLKSRRFAPLFITQFLGALNNNLYKNALIIIITFSVVNAPSNFSTTWMVNLSAGLFILPFFLFSAFAGVLADLKEKSNFIKKLKIVEIIIIFIAAVGILLSNIYLMWLSLFCMGIQAAFFGPLKYSILPQHLKNNELMAGNGLIESGTFIAILIGTIMGGILIIMNNGAIYVSILMVLFALIGYFSSRFIPLAPPYYEEEAKVSFFNSFKTTTLAGMKVKSVFLSTLAISWFWFLGATLLAQFPIIVKDTLHAPAEMVTLLLALFAIGMAIGAIFCDKLSNHRIEHGLVPLGALGMSIFLFSFGYFLYLINQDIINNRFIHLESISSWFNYIKFYILSISLFLIAVFSGFFTVPLYSFVQYRTEEKNRSKIIGSINIWNSLFMVLSAVFAIGLNTLGFSLIELIFILAILNTIVAITIFIIIPEFITRFMIWLVIKMIYKIDIQNLENLPERKMGLIMSNYKTVMDPIIIFAVSPRPVNFLIDHKIYKSPILKWLLNAVGAIPFSTKEENEVIFNESFEKIERALKAGELIILFPEGQTNKGKFDPNIVEKLNQLSVDVYPCYLEKATSKSDLLNKKTHICKLKRNDLKIVFGKRIRAKELEIEKVENIIKNLSTPTNN